MSENMNVTHKVVMSLSGIEHDVADSGDLTLAKMISGVILDGESMNNTSRRRILAMGRDVTEIHEVKFYVDGAKDPSVIATCDDKKWHLVCGDAKKDVDRSDGKVKEKDGTERRNLGADAALLVTAALEFCGVKVKKESVAKQAAKQLSEAQQKVAALVKALAAANVAPEAIAAASGLKLEDVTAILTPEA